MFMSLSAVIGKTEAEICDCLATYAMNNSGVFHQEEFKKDVLDACAISVTNGNAVIGWPNDFYDWDGCSEFISAQLKATVFSCHIHDGDLWMYVMYNNGKVVDQFNPIPDYWDDSLSAHELEEWAGNAATIASYVPGISTGDIDKYLVRWNLDELSEPAYEGDGTVQEDWQLFDFLRKLGVIVVLNEDGIVAGSTYRFRVKEKRVAEVPPQPSANPAPTPIAPVVQAAPVEPGRPTPVAAAPQERPVAPSEKPWWKIW